METNKSVSFFPRLLFSHTYVYCIHILFSIFASYIYKAVAAAEFRSRTPPRHVLSETLALCPRPGPSSSISNRDQYMSAAAPRFAAPTTATTLLAPLIGRPPFGQGQRCVRFTSIDVFGRPKCAVSFPVQTCRSITFPYKSAYLQPRNLVCSVAEYTRLLF